MTTKDNELATCLAGLRAHLDRLDGALRDTPDGAELELAADALMDAAGDHAAQAKSCERDGDVDGASDQREFSERFAQVAKWLRSIS